MFKAGQDSNRLSLQRGRAIWFLLLDSSGVPRFSVADSLEIDSWDLSQAEQCWTTWAVIQDTSGVGWRWDGCRCGVSLSGTCVCRCMCLCGLLAGGHVPLVIRTTEWYSVPVDLGLSTWGPISGSRWVKFQRKWKSVFYSLFSLLNVYYSLLSFPFPLYLVLSDKANTPRLAPREIVTLPDFDQSHPNGELILI